MRDHYKFQTSSALVPLRAYRLGAAWWMSLDILIYFCHIRYLCIAFHYNSALLLVLGYQTSFVTVVTLADRPRSVHNRFVIKHFGGVND